MRTDLVRFGERHDDDSGWERRLEIDYQRPQSSCAVEIELNDSSITCSLDDLFWLSKAIAHAREALGMDREVFFQECSPAPGGKHGAA